MPDLASLTAHLPEARVMAVLLVAALCGGLVRGFTGFGFAMIFMPIASSVVPPSLALVLIFLIDCPFALVLGPLAARRSDIRAVSTLLLAASLMLPVGLWLLVTLDPRLMRWIICGLILATLGLLMSGWRYRGRPGLPLTLGVGGVSGLFSGMASLGGMPLALFWLSSQTKTPQAIRADMQTYFGLSTLVSMGMLAFKGLLNMPALIIAAVLMPIYGLAMALGARGFHLASEATFRRIAYVIILLAALLGLPALDGVLR